jgi:hypothetical protein
MHVTIALFASFFSGYSLMHAADPRAAAYTVKRMQSRGKSNRGKTEKGKEKDPLEKSLQGGA